MAKLFFLLALIALALLACTVSAATSKYDNRGRYNPHHNDPYYNSRYYKNREFYNNRKFYDKFYKKYNPDVAPVSARIIEQEVVPNQDGAYSYSYETENGIHGEERGVAINVGHEEQKEQVSGSYSFITPEGVRVGVTYTADENGFHPTITYDGVNAEQYARMQQPADVVITKIN